MVETAKFLNGYSNSREADPFAPFVGFLYSVLVALVIKTAYLSSDFDSIPHITYTLLLLLFFAYDWVARHWGLGNIPNNMLTSTRFLQYSKLLIHIGIVFFLLVSSLKVVVLYAPPDIAKSQEHLVVEQRSLYFSVAFFAILSGAWNLIIIRLFTGFEWRPHFVTLLKGHLHSDIVEMFPGTIKKWQGYFGSEAINISHQMLQLKERGSFDSDQAQTEYRKTWQKLERKFVWAFFKTIIVMPYQLLLPYFFVFHVLLLNLVLGVFILFSMTHGDQSLSSYFISSFGIYLSSWWLAVGMLISLILLALHFKSTNKLRATFKERFGCWVLFATTIYGYSLSSSTILIKLMIIQHVIANIGMTIFFKPQVANDTPTSNGKAVS